MEEKFIAQLKEILEITDREIALDDQFRNYAEWDSLAYLSVIALIDEEFDVVIETAEFKKLLTVGDLIKEVKRRIN